MHHELPRAIALALPDRDVFGEALHSGAGRAQTGESRLANRESEVSRWPDPSGRRLPYHRGLAAVRVEILLYGVGADYELRVAEEDAVGRHRIRERVCGAHAIRQVREGAVRGAKATALLG